MHSTTLHCRCRESDSEAEGCPPRIRMIVHTTPLSEAAAADALAKLRASGYADFIVRTNAALTDDSLHISAVDYMMTNPAGETRQAVCFMPPDRFPKTPSAKSVCGIIMWDPHTQVAGNLC